MSRYGNWLVVGLLAVGLVGCGGGDDAATDDAADAKPDNKPAPVVKPDDTPSPDGPKIASGPGPKVDAGPGPKVDPNPAPKTNDPAPAVASGEPVAGAAPWMKYVGAQHVAVAVVHPKHITESPLYAALPEGLDVSRMQKEIGFDPTHTERVLVLGHPPTAKQREEFREMMENDDRKEFDEDFGAATDKAVEEAGEKFPDGDREFEIENEPATEDDGNEAGVEKEAVDESEAATEDEPQSIEDFEAELAKEEAEFEKRMAEQEKEWAAREKEWEQEPPGIGDQTFVIWFDEPIDRQAYVDSKLQPWSDEPKQIDVDGHEVWQLGTREALLFLDDQTVLGSSIPGLHELLAAKQANGPIAARLHAAGGEYDAMVVVDVANQTEMRALLRESFDKSGPEMPPNLANVPDAVGKLDAFVGRLDLSDPKTMFSLRLETKSEDVEFVETEVKNGIEIGKAGYQALGFLMPRDAPPFAKEGYAMGDKLVKSVAVTREGNAVVVTAPQPEGLVALVEEAGPAILAAQKAAEQIVYRNNLKQVGIAFHNFHETFAHLPAAAAYKTADGKPLLSWRVAILSQIEQGFLFEELVKDEAWDGETNKAYLDLMPEVYKSPGVDDPTMTTLMVLTGPSTAFHGKYELHDDDTFSKGPQFRDFTDGLSNTIAAVYAAPDKAVPWTKPQDLVFDPEKPLASIGEIPESGLQVLMWDGSVRTLPKDVAAEVFKNLVEHQDGNPVEIP